MFNAQYFRTYMMLVETGSFTQTARKLDMTQPGVSQHVRKLEEYLGRSLLNRHGRRFSLTDPGRRAYDYAVKLFAEHEHFRHSLDDDSPDSGECRIASPGSVGLMFYPFLLGYQQMHPGLTVNYSFAFNHEIAHDVVAGRYDVGIVTEISKQPDLTFEAWHQEPLCLVVPADFTGTTFSELLALGFVNYNDGNTNASLLLRSNFGSEFRSMSHFPRQGFTNEVGQVLDAVARGLGFTVVSRPVLETSPWQRQVKEMTLSQPVYETLHLVSRTDVELPKRYRQLLESFRQQRLNALYGYSDLPTLETTGSEEV
ncbi:LysR family transcriptional regulator [Salinicola sp. LHM]|jgi:DNA-binding transcriptional LysR family regulator|uniref:LysR family transcriptional regulator n=1 Tax=Salinicola TaxID=404432 RepID=UPI0008DD8840|nr:MULTISPECIES: LysR family transcriptional regulator [Salinicola]MDF3917371.1 LysR family transcriptional regulator [Salinicola salarius]OHZ04550.1 LysR family transcriptional regulator [Salinicola sp. MIT1003]WQH34913.1 LysR family transcriptional regulator [Salinicola sp. LHM]